MSIFGSKPEMKTKEVWFPLKREVATPLSSYLAQRVGKGLPGYEETTGKPLTEPFSADAETRYGEFLGMDPEKFFGEKVAKPIMERWREDVMPGIEEGWAGSLRGSGRYRDVEASATDVAKRLGELGGAMVPDIYGKQLQAAQAYKEMKDKEYQTEYKAWLQTLPEFSPAVTQAMAFLQDSTSTGKKILSGIDPGEKGWFGDLLKAGATIGAAVITGGASIPLTVGLLAGTAAVGAGAEAAMD